MNNYTVDLENLYVGKGPNPFDGMNSEFQSRVEAMISSLPMSRQGQVTIISGNRTYEQQEWLYNEYLAGRGNLAAPPGKSNHNHGLAMDLVFASDQVKTWVHRNAERFGLHFPVNGEDWHVEPIGLRDGSFNTQDWEDTHDHEGNEVGPNASYSQSDPFEDEMMDNTKVETHLQRIADTLMGGQFNVEKLLQTADPAQLAQQNQNRTVI